MNADSVAALEAGYRFQEERAEFSEREFDRVRMERDRLREALHAVLNVRCSCHCPRSQDIARTALTKAAP